MKRLLCPVCGHRGYYRTEALAKANFGRHSCATNLARHKQARRRIERLNTPGPIRECSHDSQHSHGTRAAYVLDRCRCLDCKRANREAEQVRSRDRLYGRSRLVEASLARAHVRSLMAAGMGWKRVASVAEVAPSTVSKLIYGRPSMSRPPSKQIEQTTANRLLSVQFAPAGGAIMSTVGTRRRLQALMTLGWSQAELARRLNMLPSNLAPLLHGRRQPVSRTADLVTALYERMWNQQPPTTTSSQKAVATRSRGYADQHQWAPPMAWDDDIDDAVAAPAGTLGRNRAKRPAVDPEEILMLAELGHSPSRSPPGSAAPWTASTETSPEGIDSTSGPPWPSVRSAVVPLPAGSPDHGRRLEVVSVVTVWPLLEWFIRDGDELLVDLPTTQTSSTPPKPALLPRTYRSAAVLRQTGDRLRTQQSRLGRMNGDPTMARLSGRALIWQTTRLDRRLAADSRLEARISQLSRLTESADIREARPDLSEADLFAADLSKADPS